MYYAIILLNIHRHFCFVHSKNGNTIVPVCIRTCIMWFVRESMNVCDTSSIFEIIFVIIPNFVMYISKFIENFEKFSMRAPH